jgi:hypothetical protein
VRVAGDSAAAGVRGSWGRRRGRGGPRELGETAATVTGRRRWPAREVAAHGDGEMEKSWGGAGPTNPGEAAIMEKWRNGGGPRNPREAVQVRDGEMGWRRVLRGQRENRRRETGQVEGKLRANVRA